MCNTVNATKKRKLMRSKGLKRKKEWQGDSASGPDKIGVVGSAFFSQPLFSTAPSSSLPSTLHWFLTLTQLKVFKRTEIRFDNFSLIPLSQHRELGIAIRLENQLGQVLYSIEQVQQGWTKMEHRIIEDPLNQKGKIFFPDLSFFYQIIFLHLTKKNLNREPQ